MYDQSVSSTTSSPPGQGQTEHLRLGGDGAGGLAAQGPSGHHQQQPPPEYSWNTLHQQHARLNYPPGTTAMLQQGPPPPLALGLHSQPPQQTHLQLNLPGPLPSLQSPSSSGSFWGPSTGDQHQQSPSTSTTSSRGTLSDTGYRQILHPDEINSDDDDLDSSFHSGPSSTTPDTSGSPPKKKMKGAPYIPSYMDLTNGPEPCVVCSDAATGYHYRCMTCEGCKGFFRRTIQKNLQYHCKWNNNCVIDKNTRNQCQQCRFKKCIQVGMATDLVLDEKQRVAKRRLIEENRERRKQETIKMKLKHEQCYHDFLTEEDRSLIDDIVSAYEETGINAPKPWTLPEKEGSQAETPFDPTGSQRTDPEVWQQLAEVMTPSIIKVVEFSKRVPGFIQLNVDDQILLLKSCCMEIMCLRAACRYNPGSNTLTLHNGLTLNKNQLGHGGLGMLVEPIFEFAIGLSKLQLDETEMALLAAVLLMQSDRTGLKEPEAVEKIQDAILGAYKRYIAEKRPSQPVHWAKILMKVTDLRTISTRHAERVLCIKLDSPGNIPPLFLEMFDEAPPVILLQLLMNVPPPPPPKFTVL